MFKKDMISLLTLLLFYEISYLVDFNISLHLIININPQVIYKTELLECLES